MTSDLLLPLPQILLTQGMELAQNASVLVMSPSKTAPWQLSYNTDYSFISIRHAFSCTGKEALDTPLLSSKKLQVDDVDVVIPVSYWNGDVHVA